MKQSTPFRSLAIKPTNAEAHCELGAAYRLKEKNNDALKAYLRALELPASPQTHGVAHTCLARLYHSQVDSQTLKTTATGCHHATEER